MILLALEASSESCSVAVWINGKTASITKLIPQQHAQQILPMIQTLLTSHHLKISDCAAIAFGKGPGSFTGLRIAAGVAQGLAFAHQLPLIPISSLAALALAAQKQHPHAKYLVPVLDARMHEVYFGLYKNADASLITSRSDSLAPPQQACHILKEKIDGDWVGVGIGFSVYPNVFTNLPSPIAFMPEALPNAVEVVELAHEAFQQGNLIRSYDALPNYLRNNVAQKSQ